MIALSVELPQTGPEIAAHLLGGRPYGHQVLIREDGAAVFRHKDQMNIECENTVSSTSQIRCHDANQSKIKHMIRHKAFVFKLKPDGATRRSLAKACGCVRFVYNKGLDWNKEQREKDQTFRVSYPKLCALLPEWKEKFPWLGECHSQVLQQGMKDLMTAMVNFFEGRSQFPRFHKKFKDEDSIRFPQGFKVDEARRQIYLPKIGWLGYRRSRFINGKLRSVTVMRKADGWYVSILTEREIEAPVHPKAGREIGLDAGVKKTAALSNGKIYLPVDAFRSSKDKLAKMQRRLKRMVPHSENWKKQQQKIAVLHKEIADTRRDHLQKLANDICKNHAVVYREDLKIKNMTASAKGTLEEPGKNVRQKSGLNAAILDQGWGILFGLLDQKMEELGGEVFAVPPANTSRTCPKCEDVSPLNRLTQARFCCRKCGFEGNADVVAANNILRRGQRLRACGELQSTAAVQVNRPSRKRRAGQQQEPIRRDPQAPENA